MAAATLGRAQSTYTLTDLGTLPGATQSWTTGINATGQVVGYSSGGAVPSRRAFLYAAGTLSDLGVLLGAVDSMATAINASGQIVGQSGTRAFLYSGGTMSDLGTLGGVTGARAINASGQIVGQSWNSSGRAHAFLYASGQMADLGTLGGWYSEASGINDSGQIVGGAEIGPDNFGPGHAYLYSADRMADLGTLGGSDSWARGINASGHVVGTSWFGNNRTPRIDGLHAFLYSGGRMLDLGTLPPYDSSQARAINASGQVVGSVFDFATGYGDTGRNQRAFLHAAGRMFDLNTLVIGAAGWVLLQATAINDNGAIAGFGQTPTGDIRAFLLTPASHPLRPAIRTPPVSQHVIAGAPVLLTVTTTGIDLEYQWKKDGVAIAGATRTSYAIASATTSAMGFYSVVATGGGTSVESAPAIVTVASPPATESHTFTTIAGSAGQSGTANGAGSDARFNWPSGVAVDRDGNLFIADSNNGSIRKVTPAGGVTTITSGRIADNSVAVDRSGDVYFNHRGANVIRKLSRSGVITTLAGAENQSGIVDGSGAVARFASPSGIAVDANGNVVVADRGNYTIRRITPAGEVTTVAGRPGISGHADGMGSAARFDDPTGVAVDASGNIFVCETVTCIIRKISADGMVTTLAGTAGRSGSADGTGAAARFMYPFGVATDAAGNVFVADRMNHTIRRITATGIVTTVGGAASRQGSTDGPSTTARFNTPTGIAVDEAGSLFIADEYNHTIRKAVPLPALAPPVSRLTNISTRGFLPAGGDLTVGFVIRGSGSKSVLVRAVGPTLGTFGVADALADPRLDITSVGGSAATHSNDDWGGGAVLADGFAGVGAFALPVTSKDAAIVTTMAAAGYSARVTSAPAGGSGIAIAEVYDRDASNATSRLANISTLGFVGGGARALAPGFVISGIEPKQLLIRAVGPGLASFGVSETLADPQFAVIPLGQVAAVIGSDNWDGSTALANAFTQAGAFPLAHDSRDAAVVVRLPPGGYTVVVSDAANATGNALVEVYDLDP